MRFITLIIRYFFAYPYAFTYVHLRSLKWFFQNLRTVPDVEEEHDLANIDVDKRLESKWPRAEWLDPDVVEAIANTNFKTIGEFNPLMGRDIYLIPHKRVHVCQWYREGYGEEPEETSREEEGVYESVLS